MRRAMASSASTSPATSCCIRRWSRIASRIAIAAAAGLGLTAHAAEAGPASAARDAVEMLGVTRIGHGSHIADDTGGARLGRQGRRGDRGLPDLERPDRRRAVDP